MSTTTHQIFGKNVHKAKLPFSKKGFLKDLLKLHKELSDDDNVSLSNNAGKLKGETLS